MTDPGRYDAPTVYDEDDGGPSNNMMMLRQRLIPVHIMRSKKEEPASKLSSPYQLARKRHLRDVHRLRGMRICQTYTTALLW